MAHDLRGAVNLRAHLFHEAYYRSLMLVHVVAIPPTGSPFFTFVREHADAIVNPGQPRSAPLGLRLLYHLEGPQRRIRRRRLRAFALGASASSAAWER